MTREQPSTAPLALGLDDVLERVRELARDVVAPAAPEIDRTATWPEANLRALLDAGLGGLVVAREHGGHGFGLHALARVCEVLGSECASTAICFGMHCVGSAVIGAKATEDQAERYLAPIAAGRHLTTLALSEPGSGAHFYIPQARVAADDDGFVLNGAKTFVTNGSHADSYVVSVAAEHAPAGEFSCVVLDAGSEGMVWGGPWAGFGMRGNDSRALELRDVRLPRRALLGREGDELWYVFQVVAPYFLMAMAGTYLGVAHAAFEEARSHVRRRTYGTGASRPGASAVVQHRLGSLWAQVERTRTLVYAAAVRADEGGADALPGVLSAKAEVADCAVAVANEAMTLSGGVSYRENAKLQRHLRDARAAHVMAPVTDMLRTWTGRALLDQPLLAD